MNVEGAINPGEARRLSARGIRSRRDAVEDLKDIIARCGGSVGDAADRLGVTADEVTNTRTGRHAFLDALLTGMYGKGGGHVVDLAGLGLAGHRIAEAAAAALKIGDPTLTATPVAAPPPPAPPAGGRGADAAPFGSARDEEVAARREETALFRQGTTRAAVLARLAAIKAGCGNWLLVGEVTGLSPTTACSLAGGKMRFGERTIAKIMMAPIPHSAARPAVSLAGAHQGADRGAALASPSPAPIADAEAAAPAGQTPASLAATDREVAAALPAGGAEVAAVPVPLPPAPSMGEVMADLNQKFGELNEVVAEAAIASAEFERMLIIDEPPSGSWHAALTRPLHARMAALSRQGGAAEARLAGAEAELRAELEAVRDRHVARLDAMEAARAAIMAEKAKVFAALSACAALSPDDFAADFGLEDLAA